MQTRPSAKPSLICKVSNLLWTFSCTWCQDVGFTLCTPACLKMRSCCSEVSAQNQQSGAKKNSGGPITGPRKCKNDDGATAPWRFRLSVFQNEARKNEILNHCGICPAKRCKLVFTSLDLLVGPPLELRRCSLKGHPNSSPISTGCFGRMTKALGSPSVLQASKVVRDSLQQKMSLA